ncbi:PLD nuclease N-terminal domain-containing protein [Stutzerimonas azotifigens]|uniref:PLDc_N domain-containing protein n=1 Tax=Stutzerimonas azotifigens TaxID=291995 RepID=A0ABR5Z1D7_9GAMM|nr:PLD nuclease N-terminal domain-containing protein [Stutzerimonas azotifigens]MBA1274004.1 PLDc_N domain-containing protein [Stutzerimonas azotifigens]
MSDAFSYVAIITAVVIILLDLWAIVSVFRSDRGVGPKALWAIGISLFPIIGLIVWAIAGPRAVKAGPVWRSPDP